jgi:hypothetical protein
MFVPVLYGFKIGLTLRKVHRLTVFENRVLRGIVGLKRDEVTRGWRKLHEEEFHNLYCAPSIVRKEDEMGGACGTHGGDEKYIGYIVLVGKN